MHAVTVFWVGVLALFSGIFGGHTPTPAPVQVPAQQITREQLLGAWVEDLSNPADTEACKNDKDDEVCFSDDTYEVDFSIVSDEFVFNSYLHHRPYLSNCTWGVHENVVNVQCGQKEQSTMFKIVSLDDTNLELTEDKEGDIEYFRKFVPKNQTVTIIATSTKGSPVAITFTRCDSTDTTSCFGSGAEPAGEVRGVLVWGQVSTSDKQYFGIESKTGNKWPYAVEVNYKGKGYDEADYAYFKNKIPELFLKNVKVSQ